MHELFVRIGSLAEVYAVRSPTAMQRGRRVIVRTSRGVELGEVIGPRNASTTADDSAPVDDSAPRLLRPTTDEDELLIRRLDRHKREAVEACRRELAESGSKATLLDVDQLFDGGTLLMHFLGPVDEVAESISRRVAEKYESIVRSRHFSKLLRDGCGPDCGTKEGCGSSCQNCSIGCKG